MQTLNSFVASVWKGFSKGFSYVYVLKCQFDNVYGLIFSRNEMKVDVNGFSPSNLPDSIASTAFYK